MSDPKLVLTIDDQVEMFHAFRSRGDSDTRTRVAQFLRDCDAHVGVATPDDNWYADPA